jgi:hypothetical protein
VSFLKNRQHADYRYFDGSYRAASSIAALGTLFLWRRLSDAHGTNGPPARPFRWPRRDASATAPRRPRSRAAAAPAVLPAFRTFSQSPPKADLKNWEKMFVELDFDFEGGFVELDFDFEVVCEVVCACLVAWCCVAASCFEA